MSFLADTMLSPLTEQAVTLPMSRLTDLVEDMVYRLPGCDDLMVRKELQRAARDFCRTTGALRVTAEYDITATGRIPLSVPFEADVLVIHGAAIGTTQVRREYMALLDGVPPTLVLSESALSLADAMDESTVEVAVSLVPKNGAEELPEWFLAKHGNGILSLAMAGLFSMANRPWSDPGQAMLEHNAAKSAMSDACVQVRRGSGIAGDLNCRSQTPWL